MAIGRSLDAQSGFVTTAESREPAEPVRSPRYSPTVMSHRSRSFELAAAALTSSFEGERFSVVRIARVPSRFDSCKFFFLSLSR